MQVTVNLGVKITSSEALDTKLLKKGWFYFMNQKEMYMSLQWLKN